MTQLKNGFSLILIGILFFSSACNKNKTPSTTPPNPNYLYLALYQNSPGCPVTLTVTGPTSFSDVLGTNSIFSQIAINYTTGGYVFALNGASDGVTHNLSGAETITYSPVSTTACPGWTYTVNP